jgi:hypothetical protein
MRSPRRFAVNMTRELVDALLAANGVTDPVWVRLDKLVRRAANAVGRSGQPPSADGQPWTATSLEDLAQDFWDLGSADKVVLASRDDTHLRALVHLEVKHVATRQLRKSGRAALNDRIVDVLGKGHFVKAGAYWRLPEQVAGTTYQGSRRDLLEAAFEIPVTRQYVKESSKRESSFASRDQLEAMIRAVLERAGAAVSLAELREVAQRWLNLHSPYSSVALDDDFPSNDEPIGLYADVANHVDRIWARLGKDGRELLLFMDPKKNSSRATAAVVGYGHDKVSRIISATYEILGDELQNLPEDEQLAIVRHLKDRQRHQLATQTKQADSALEAGGDQ